VIDGGRTIAVRRLRASARAGVGRRAVGVGRSWPDGEVGLGGARRLRRGGGGRGGGAAWYRRGRAHDARARLHGARPRRLRWWWPREHGVDGVGWLDRLDGVGGDQRRRRLHLRARRGDVPVRGRVRRGGEGGAGAELPAAARLGGRV